MKFLKYIKIVIGISLLFVTSSMYAQTLFESPDTTPDHMRYKHIEECWQAGFRMTAAHRTSLDSIWQDTLNSEAVEKLGLSHEKTHRYFSITRRPEAAIEVISGCLNKFNVDTVKIVTPPQAMRIMKILLFAHRDDDADRFAQRFLDSVRRESKNNSDSLVRIRSLRTYKDGLAQLMGVYGAARPRRYDVAKKYYNQYLVAVAGDSLYYSIDAAINMSTLAHFMGEDSIAQRDRNEAERLALSLNDSTPEKERKESPRSTIRLAALAGFIAQFTSQEALDSIAISTVAYNLWYGNTVHKRVYGGEIITREKAQPKKLPEIRGAFYYIADNMFPDTARRGLASYSVKGAIPDGESPVKNKLNYFVSLPSLCHTQTAGRTPDDNMYKNMMNDCYSYTAKIRNFKRDYPEIEITGLSSTYGTVGSLGPLTPAQEADTLAKLFLAYYHVPARLVVENTEIFRVAAPDGRRVDLPTENSEALEMSVMNSNDLRLLTDKEGYIVKIVNGVDFKRFYEILRDRPSSTPAKL